MSKWKIKIPTVVCLYNAAITLNRGQVWQGELYDTTYEVHKGFVDLSISKEDWECWAEVVEE